MKNLINYNYIQLIQTTVLISILLIGVYLFGLDLTIYEIIVVFISVVFFDLILGYIFTKDKGDFVNLSKINISFGILFFLRTDIILIYILTSFIAVLSKYLFTYNKKHFLNPSNFGLSISLLFFSPFAYTNPLQWEFFVSEQTYFLFFIVVLFLGLFLVEYFLQKFLKFNQLPLIFAFLLSHLFLFNFIGINEGWGSNTDFFNITFLIFTFFMITDPKTTPTNYINKAIFGINIALTFYILSYFTNENFNLIWSLFFNTLFLPFIRKFEEKYARYKVFVPSVILLFLFIFILFVLNIIYGGLDLQFINRCISVFCY